MRPRSIGVIGYGQFGRFLEELAHTYLPGVGVRVFSRRAALDGTRFFSFEEVCAADVVVIATAIREFEETLLNVFPLMREDATLVEVSTVKEHPVRLLARHALGKRYVATHPMFGPYSFEKQGRSLAGLRLVVAEHTLPKETYEAALAFLRGLSLSVLEMSPEEHDKRLAETLFLTHYLAQSVNAGGFTRTDIDTLSFGYLMDAVESVREDTALFRDVYAFNPHCKEVVERVKRAEQDVDALLRTKDGP